MTNDEISIVYNALREYLIRNNFGWIVNQVDEEILRGKSLTKSIKEIGLNKMFLDAIENKKALAKEVVVSESYSITEQLGILIDGIEIGITDPYEITEEMFAVINKDASVKRRVVFVTENRTEENVISLNQLQLLNEKRKKLTELLNELKLQLNDAN